MGGVSLLIDELQILLMVLLVFAGDTLLICLFVHVCEQMDGVHVRSNHLIPEQILLLHKGQAIIQID